MKLLIAEDTRDLNRALTAVFTHEQYQVDSAFDGLEAMKFIEENEYDAIVLDIMMPGKDGLTVLRETRAMNIDTPVLLLTARAEAVRPLNVFVIFFILFPHFNGCCRPGTPGRAITE